MTRTLPALVALAAALAAPPPARAAFVIHDGLDPAERPRLTLAVVRIAAVRPTGKPGCRGFTSTPCLDLQVVQQVHGVRLPAAGLRDIPFATMANTAWEAPPGRLEGAHYLMAWIHGFPCGIGLAVSLGPRVLLPHLLTDAADPLVPAVRSILAATSDPAAAARRAAVERLVASTDPSLAHLADGARLGLDPDWARSHRRYRALLDRVDLDPRAPGWRAEGPLIEASRFPVPTRADAWARWAGVTADVPAAFLAFRAAVRDRLLAVARRTTARPTLRALALSRLAFPPVRLGEGDPFERSTTDRLRVALQLTTGEVRREAFRALHAHTRGTPRWDRHHTELLRRELRAAVKAEPSAAERRILERILAGR